MSKNTSIERMKQRREEAKQHASEGNEEQSATVAGSFRTPNSELTAQINVRLTPEFRKKLNAWCALNDTSVQELVPMLLEEHLRENPLT